MNIVYGFAGSNASWNENFLTKMSEENGSCLGVPSDSTGVILKIPNETSTRVKATRKETPAWSSIATNKNSLGVENKGLHVSESELSLYHPDEFKGTNLYKLPSSTATPDSLEMTCCSSSLYRMNSKLSSVSSDPESALPVPPAPKKIRAWLTDPQLYKVHWHMPCGLSRLDCNIIVSFLFPSVKVAIVMTCTRILHNHSYAYLPLFLIYRLQFGKVRIYFKQFCEYATISPISMFICPPVHPSIHPFYSFFSLHVILIFFSSSISSIKLFLSLHPFIFTQLYCIQYFLRPVSKLVYW